MKTTDDILLIGDSRLHETCQAVSKSELPNVKSWVADLKSAMQDVRTKYGFGRGIAAPQLAIFKRLIYIDLDRPYIIINPEITWRSDEQFELWDDCMSFPNLLVKVKRHQAISFTYYDEDWVSRDMRVENGFAELFQHEYDHLNGILATERAIHGQAFKWKKTI